MSHLQDVADMAVSYYEIDGHSEGGSLHLFLIEESVEDSAIDLCIDTARRAGDLAGWGLGLLLRAMNRTERRAVLNITFGPRAVLD